jgi:hypothetical protein
MKITHREFDSLIILKINIYHFLYFGNSKWGWYVHFIVAWQVLVSKQFTHTYTTFSREFNSRGFLIPYIKNEWSVIYDEEYINETIRIKCLNSKTVFSSFFSRSFSLRRHTIPKTEIGFSNHHMGILLTLNLKQTRVQRFNIDNLFVYSWCHMFFLITLYNYQKSKLVYLWVYQLSKIKVSLYNDASQNKCNGNTSLLWIFKTHFRKAHTFLFEFLSSYQISMV